MTSEALAGLQRILLDMFNVNELRHFILRGQLDGQQILEMVTQPAPPAQVAFEIVQILAKRSLLTDEFFIRLLEERPNRSDDVVQFMKTNNLYTEIFELKLNLFHERRESSSLRLSLESEKKRTKQATDELDKKLKEASDMVVSLKMEVNALRKERGAKINSDSVEFVDASQRLLASRENGYRRVAYFCYFLGVVAILTGAALATYRVVAGSQFLSSWVSFAEFAAMGVVALSLFVAAGRYLFVMGRAFMTESVRNSDRNHAIEFGKFYLKVFGGSIEKGEMRDIFQHWNAGSSTEFSRQDPESFDPKLMDRATELIRSTRRDGPDAGGNK